MNRPDQPFLFDPSPPPAAHPAPSDPQTVVREIRCRNVLNRCNIDDYSFNAYVGCQHACGYCYARFMQRFHPHSEPWGRFVDVKVNAPDALARQLRRLPPGTVFTCSACDGWQPLERDYRLTRRCCQLLLDAGFRLNILTKSDLVLRDLDLFVGRDVRLGVTITTPDESTARIWEPGASSVAARLEVLRQAKAAGLATTVMFGPLLPGLSDTDAALADLFAAAADVGVDHIWTDILNPRPRVWPSVQNVLRRHWPDLYEPCRRLLFDPAARRTYQHQLDAHIHRAAAQARLSDRLSR